MIDAKLPILIAQTILWAIFMIIDANLLIPSIVYRYLCRIKSQHELNNQRNRTPKTVVIVGANFAGLAALRELQNNPLFRVILIDQRQFLEYTPGILRLFCEPHAIHKLAHPLPHGSHYIIHGTVTKTSHSHLTYIDGTTKKSHSLKFDYMIFATGSTYNAPVTALPTETTIEARALGWKVAAQKVQQAVSILILGGGAVGTELAAEIVDYYGPEKRITVVDASPKLVPLFAPEVSEYAEKWLKDKGVRLVLGQKLETWDTKSCTLQNGQVLKADLVHVCFGDKPNSACLKNDTRSTALTNGDKGVKATPPSVQLDRRNCVKVDGFLRVEGRQNVFSCGDVATPPTEGFKQAYHAEAMGHIAGENIKRLATGRPFVRYPEDAAAGSDQMPMVYVLSLGKWDGVIGFNSLCIPGPLAALVKWVIEWTKIRQMLGRPVGLIIWKFGDVATTLISKHILLPVPKKQA
jgi:apoptosis-inducing factor 2